MSSSRIRTNLLDEDERRLIGPYLSGNMLSSGEWRAFCPRCENPKTSNSPSASFNFKSNVWRCFHCDRGGKITVLMRDLLKRERDGAPEADVIDMKSRQRVAPPLILPSPQNILNWHKTLLASPNSMRILRDRRGWSRATLERFQIGLSAMHKRYTIPVYGRDGKTLLAVKLYRPTAKRPTPKMIFWTPGGGEDDSNSVSLFNSVALDMGDDIMLCEGEPDCIINAQNGILTVAHTAGSSGFQMEWAPEFKGKNVYICYDDDEAGAYGAVKTAKMLADFAKSVYIVPLKTGIKSGDLTDWYVRLNRTAGHLRDLCEAAEPFTVLEEKHDVPTSGMAVSLVDSQNPGHNGNPLELIVSIAGKQSPPYLAPKRIAIECDRKKGDRCKVCPMFQHEGERELVTYQDDPTLLRFVGANDAARRRIILELSGALCDDHVTRAEALEDWALEELVVVQSVGHRTEEAQQPMNRKVFNVGTFATPVNSTVRVVGRQLPDSRDSRGLFHGWHLEPVEVDIDKFTMTPELREQLAIFQKTKGQSSLDKCMEIADDMAANVTGIKGRPLLHVAYDLVWHSVQYYDFGGQRIAKGWLEGIAIGDTRTGKSEAAERLARHYNSGLIKSCEGATFAGLVGGATQMPQGRGWMVTWGTIPLHDRRLVVLDELSGIKDKDIIEQMSSIRSSGVAQLTKIVSEETSARTRLFWLTNDPDGKRMAETDGMDALQRLVKNPEDIARFDFALALSNSDVPSALINSGERLGTPKYPSELCTSLVLWAWSRKPDQVRWMSDAEGKIISAAEEVGGRYVSTPPLVQVENIRLKLARLAVAFAARTFSTNRDGTVVLVRPEHVVSAVAFLDAVYGSEVMGYARHSRRTLAARAEAKRNKPKVKRWLQARPGVLDVLRAVGTDKFRLRDFDEFGSLDSGNGDPIDPRTLVHQLLSWRMIRRLVGDRGYITAEPALIEVLKELEDKGL